MADIVFVGQAPSAVLGSDELPSNVDLVLYRGDFREFTIQLKDSAGNVVDLSSQQAKAQMRQSYSATDAVDLECSVDSESQVTVYISSAVSETLDPSKSYIWDLQTTNYRGDVRTWLTGDVSVMDEVTR